MTTNVTIKVGGDYQAKVKTTLIDENGHLGIQKDLLVGPQDEVTIGVPHDQAFMMEIRETKPEKKEEEKE